MVVAPRKLSPPPLSPRLRHAGGPRPGGELGPVMGRGRARQVGHVELHRRKIPGEASALPQHMRKRPPRRDREPAQLPLPLRVGHLGDTLDLHDLGVHQAAAVEDVLLIAELQLDAGVQVEDQMVCSLDTIRTWMTGLVPEPSSNASKPTDCGITSGLVTLKDAVLNLTAGKIIESR